jgi:mono/diheme cytochrome c family protein
MGHHDSKPKPVEPRLTGVVARFDTPEAVMKAAEAVRVAGFTKWDVHTPFPIHGLDDAMAIRPTILPWIVVVMAVTGFSVALGLQFFANAVFYPFIISGKPTFAIEPCLPVCFEVTVLLSAFGAFFGMLGLNGLPKPSNELLRSAGFDRATSDRFFIAIDATDRKFEQSRSRAFLSELGGDNVQSLYTTPAEEEFPAILHTIALTAACFAICVPLAVAVRRYSDQTVPRLHLIPDMDFQAKKKTQKTTGLFADGRIMRPPVAGTVARGELATDAALFQGLSATTGLMSVADEKKPEGDAGAAPAAPVDPAVAAAEREKKPWVKTIPIPVDDKFMARGKQRFEIYCSMCHGLTGIGDGLVARKGDELLNLGKAKWTKPVALTAEAIIKQPVGQLFDTVTHGVRRMPGYGDQVPVNDRWAIVAYVKALQLSQAATEADIPAEDLEKLKKN